MKPPNPSRGAPGGSLNVATILTARLASQRLPRKVMAPFLGKTLLENCYESCVALGWPVCVACPKSDRELLRFVWEKGWTWFAGSDEDVLERMVGAARMMRADWVCRVTHDQPRVVLAELIPLWALEMACREAKTPH